jgi:putative tryptophan/tyrosine transport system substrate-binding protein
MRRREFIALLGSSGFAWPLAARAQQPGKMPMIGALMLVAPDDPDTRARLKAFNEGLEALGWIDGKTVRIEYRWAAGDQSKIDRYAAELVGLKPDVILANGTPVVATLKHATTSIPIVCALVIDPVGLGLVASLARPGGNITGFSFVNTELIGKWSELLAEVAPSTKRTAILFNPIINPWYFNFLREMGPAKPGTPEIAPMTAQTIETLHSVITELGHIEGASLIMGPDAFVLAHVKEIAALAMEYRLPSISVYRQFAVEGGLMSYGPDVPDIFRRSASYIDRILKGTSPAELPVQQPDRFEFVINLKTAKALGLTIPLPLLGRADEVIE